MGRTLRRVPMDFSWPLQKKWGGYLNPHYSPCPEEESGLCQNGYTAAGQWLNSLCTLMSLMATGAQEAPRADELRARGSRYPHPYLEFENAPSTTLPRRVTLDIREMPVGPAKDAALRAAMRDYPSRLLPLTPELQTLLEGLAGTTTDDGIGSRLSYALSRRLKEFAGVDPETWGICPVCKGTGQDPATQAAYDAWTPTDPPSGEGYQLWETTSEGSPVSPVFGDLDALCTWCEDNATTFGSEKATKEAWRAMLDENFVRHEVSDGAGNTMVFM